MQLSFSVEETIVPKGLWNNRRHFLLRELTCTFAKRKICAEYMFAYFTRATKVPSWYIAPGTPVVKH